MENSKQPAYPTENNNQNLERLMSKASINGDCIEYTGGISGNGYGVFWMNGKNENAHRASYKLNKGEIDDSKWVLHTCDNKKCINPLHLYLGDHKQNTLDAMIRGRMATGDNHGSKKHPQSFKRTHAVFTDEQCLEIKKSNLKASELSKKYNVHYTTIYRAIKHADALLTELNKPTNK